MYTQESPHLAAQHSHVNLLNPMGPQSSRVIAVWQLLHDEAFLAGLQAAWGKATPGAVPGCFPCISSKTVHAHGKHKWCRLCGCHSTTQVHPFLASIGLCSHLDGLPLQDSSLMWHSVMPPDLICIALPGCSALLPTIKPTTLVKPTLHW